MCVKMKRALLRRCDFLHKPLFVHHCCGLLSGQSARSFKLPSRLTKHMLCMSHAQYFISLINILKPTFCSLNTPNLKGVTMYDSHLFTFSLLSRVVPARARHLSYSFVVRTLGNLSQFGYLACDI